MHQRYLDSKDAPQQQRCASAAEIPEQQRYLSSRDVSPSSTSTQQRWTSAAAEMDFSSKRVIVTLWRESEIKEMSLEMFSKRGN